MPISNLFKSFVGQIKELRGLYDTEVNRQRRTTPRILNEVAFTTIERKLTRYVLDLAIREWSTAKKMADDIEDGKEDEFEFAPLAVNCQ